MNMDGIEWQRPKWGPATKTWFKLNEWFGCIFSNHLVADHDEIKNHLISRHGYLPISTIPYGASAVTESSTSQLKSYNLNPREYFLVIARPEPENSILDIVRGFVESHSKKKLVLLGNYNQANNYQAQVMKISDNRVIFLGALYDRDVVSALRYHSFAYIHGHTVGGTNPSLVEAMGAGCSIIAHDNRFNRGVCTNAAFYFRHSNDLKNILDNADDDAIDELKKHAYLRFNEKYTLDIVNKAYIDLFFKFLNETG
jgi:glycosyltransferase involved in cell wall biosynthesis